MSLDIPLASVHFVWALGAISQLKRTPFAPELVEQQFPPPHSATTLLQAAAALGFKAERHARAANEIQRVPLPCLAVLRLAGTGAESPGDARLGGEKDQPDDPSAHALALVIQADDERIVLLEPGAAGGATLSTADFNHRYAGESILFASQPEPLADADAAAGRKEAFGFSWFIPPH